MPLSLVPSIEDLPVALHAEAVALWHACALTRPWNDPAADLARAVAGPASTVLALLDEGRLLATVMVGVDGHRGWLYYLAVDPSERGRGHGRALVQAAETWVVDRGVPKVMLMVRSSNTAALAFYERLGWNVEEVSVLSRWLTR